MGVTKSIIVCGFELEPYKVMVAVTVGKQPSSARRRSTSARVTVCTKWIMHYCTILTNIIVVSIIKWTNGGLSVECLSEMTGLSLREWHIINIPSLFLWMIKSMNPTALVCAHGSIDNALIRTDLALYQLSSRHVAFQFSAHLIGKWRPTCEMKQQSKLYFDASVLFYFSTIYL